MERGRRAREQECCLAKRSGGINLGPSTRARNLKNNLDPRRMMPTDDLVGKAGKKRKATVCKFDQPNKRRLPEKVNTASLREDVAPDNCIHRPLSNRCSELAESNVDKRKQDGQVIRSSCENECSVASCSLNDLQYPTHGNKQSVELASCFSDDAMSACPSTTGREDDDTLGDDLATHIHELELQAYQSTVQALYASGPLTWEQELLLTNLRLSLNISNEEHLLQLRLLLST